MNTQFKSSFIGVDFHHYDYGCKTINNLATGIQPRIPIGIIDSLGALRLIYFSINEGREAFEKAASVE
jgi:hypothetical protein